MTQWTLASSSPYEEGEALNSSYNSQAPLFITLGRRHILCKIHFSFPMLSYFCMDFILWKEEKVSKTGKVMK